MKKINLNQRITILFFFFFNFFTVNVTAQEIYFDEDIPINTDRLPQETKFVDRWGYPWINSSQSFSTANSAIINCSGFNLTFADFDNSTGKGFDDQIIVTLPQGHPLGVATI